LKSNATSLNVKGILHQGCLLFWCCTTGTGIGICSNELRNRNF